jgi:hypothetical protein
MKKILILAITLICHSLSALSAATKENAAQMPFTAEFALINGETFTFRIVSRSGIKGVFSAQILPGTPNGYTRKTLTADRPFVKYLIILSNHLSGLL